MNSNSDTTQKSSFMTGLRMAFERFIMRKVHRPDLPYIPQPDQIFSSPMLDSNGDYAETEVDVQPLHGTSITFGTQKSTQIDEHGRAKAIKQNPSYIIGTKKRISSIDEIGGVCEFCQIQATQAYDKGKMTLQQAQLQSLFDVKSGRQCDICGIYTCSRHCRQTPTLDGIVSICTACQDDIRHQQRKTKVISFLLSPFVDSETPEKD